MHGYTDNYVKVAFPYDENLANTITNVQLAEITRDGIVKAELALAI
jgi:hypothetical protein